MGAETAAHMTMRSHIARLWWRLRMMGVLAALPLALRLTSAGRVAAALTPRTIGPPRPDLLDDTARWVDRIVDLRPFRFWGHCLRRSLTLYYAATRMGYPVRIAVGVRYEHDSLSGHGWLELHGVPFLEYGTAPEQRFVIITRFPLDA